jgi:histidyl-tRNA synthetase
MGVERLLSIVEPKPPAERFVHVVYLGEEAKKEAILLTRLLRSRGIECLLEFKGRGLRSQLGRASKLQASWALIIGEDEVRKKRYQLKDLKAGTQTELAGEEIPKAIAESDR